MFERWVTNRRLWEHGNDWKFWSPPSPSVTMVTFSPVERSLTGEYYSQACLNEKQKRCLEEIVLGYLLERLVDE